MQLSEMSQEERNLLLFFEARSAENGGAVKTAQMNANYFRIAKRWNESGFVFFGRIASHCHSSTRGATSWCELSDEAWVIAAAERRARYERKNCTRKWITTDEKREG